GVAAGGGPGPAARGPPGLLARARIARRRGTVLPRGAAAGRRRIPSAARTSRQSPSGHRPVDGEPDDRSDQRAHASRGLAGLIKPQGASQKPSDERPDDPEQNRDDEAAGITARHDELGERADDQTEQNPAENAHVRDPPAGKNSKQRATVESDEIARS